MTSENDIPEGYVLCSIINISGFKEKERNGRKSQEFTNKKSDFWLFLDFHGCYESTEFLFPGKGSGFLGKKLVTFLKMCNVWQLHCCDESYFNELL